MDSGNNLKMSDALKTKLQSNGELSLNSKASDALIKHLECLESSLHEYESSFKSLNSLISLLDRDNRKNQGE